VGFAEGVEENDQFPEVSFVTLQLACADVSGEPVDVDADGKP
jgi:hypothetical protein